MDSPSSKLLSFEQSDSKIRILGFVIFFVFLAAVFYFVNLHLYQLGFMSNQLVYFGEKARLAYEGLAPKLSNIFFIQPFLPYFFILLFYSPLVASAIIGSFVVTILLYKISYLARNRFGLGIVVILVAYLCLSPAAIFLLAQDPYHTVLFFMTFMTSLSLRRYYIEKNSIELLYFGIFAALYFSLSQIKWFLFLIYFPLLFLINKIQNRPFFFHSRDCNFSYALFGIFSGSFRLGLPQVRVFASQ